MPTVKHNPNLDLFCGLVGSSMYYTLSRRPQAYIAHRTQAPINNDPSFCSLRRAGIPEQALQSRHPRAGLLQSPRVSLLLSLSLTCIT
jgi:hypothetical protein